MTDYFGHLHRHGEFSRLDGIGTAKQYASRAAELGQGFLAQTDHGTLSGALHHIAACRKSGIVPIVGVEAYYRPNRSSRMTRQAWHLILLAKNLKGWNNLLKICSKAYAEQEDGGGFYQYPCIDDELLGLYHEGLICSSACFQSWLANLIKSGDSVAVRDHVRMMKNLFKGDYWLEIQPHDFDDQRELNLEIVSIANDESVGLVATNDAHFVLPEWAETQRVAKMMATNLSFSKIEKLHEKNEEIPYLAELLPNLYLSSRQEMENWFSKFHPGIDPDVIDQSLDNTQLLASKIVPFVLDRTDKLPKITATPLEAEQLLSGWIDEGLNRIQDEYPEKHWIKYAFEVYEDRIAFEWDILQSKGVIPYMVMVADVVRWAKREGIRIGLGRGSAAGCLISYLVGITAIDPIPWGLLFERFLNPGRKGLPDIDIDVQSERRAEVKGYIIGKYGAEHVADIITHTRFQPKSVLQSLCRVFDVPYVEAQGVTDTIDIRADDEETTLEELLPLNDKLKEFKAKYPHIWEHATRLEGTVQNAGKHAAGIVITPKPVIEYMALERGKAGDLVTSWSDSADFMVISDNGFVKLDLLGIKNLDRHEYACRLIEKRHGVRVDLDKLPFLRDPMEVPEGTLNVFRNGYTIGVFQFGSKGITNLIKEISPDNALDLTAANALYRPGPMKGGVTWDYARIKQGRKEREKWSKNPLVAPVLDESYGLICYQEQVMEVSKRLANFSPAQADDLRKAMGKLYRIKGGKAAKEFMARYDEQWARGIKENNVPEKDADTIWHKFLEFGHYGFNKSHSGSYTCSALQDGWLKDNYALEIYAAMLTYPSGSTPKAKLEFISTIVREARHRGIEILPPDVNTSELGWTVHDDALRFGLLSIKDVGDVAAAKIILKREDGFESIDDVRQKCGGKVNKKVIDALFESGAFDCFGARDEFSLKQIAIWEKNRLKMMIKGVGYMDKYDHLIRPNIYTQEEVEALPNGTKDVIVGGEVTRVEKKKTKNNKDFANVTIVFDMNEWRCKFWEYQMLAFEDILVEGKIIMVNGRKDEWNGFVSVVANEATEIETLEEEIKA